MDESVLIETGNIKRCRDCNIIQTLSNTNLSRAKAGGIRSFGTYCKQCANARARASRERARKRKGPTSLSHSPERVTKKSVQASTPELPEPALCYAINCLKPCSDQSTCITLKGKAYCSANCAMEYMLQERNARAARLGLSSITSLSKGQRTLLGAGLNMVGESLPGSDSGED